MDHVRKCVAYRTPGACSCSGRTITYDYMKEIREFSEAMEARKKKSLLAREQDRRAVR
jgi:hypothetical protein